MQGHLQEWDRDGEWDQERDGGESVPEAPGRKARKRHTGKQDMQAAM